MKKIISFYYPVLIQSILYFVAKLLSNNYHLITSNIDNKIPFISWFVYFYVAWYLFLILVPIILNKYDEDKRKKYNLLLSIGASICFLIYIIYPTYIIRADVEVNSLSSLIVSIIYYLDTPGLNCFPSLHILICIIWIYLFSNFKNKKYKYLMIIFSALVILSTLFIKQHVIYDGIGSLIVFLISLIIIKVTAK